jgi:hypothetical protein
MLLGLRRCSTLACRAVKTPQTVVNHLVYRKKPKMIVTINPSITLDKDIPVESEILEYHDLGILDSKNLMLIGHLAIKASTRHLQTDSAKKQLEALKDAYDKVIENIRSDATDQVNGAKSDLKSQKALYEDMIREIKEKHNEHLNGIKNDMQIVRNNYMDFINQAQENFEQEQADPDNRPSNRRDLGNGRTEVS